MAGRQLVKERSDNESCNRNEGWQMEQGEIPTTSANPILQRQGSRRSTSDGKYRQENSRCGSDKLANIGR
jgi:hypothetical protein